MANVLNITGLGELEIVETYVYYDQPVLFSCKSAAGHLYLAVAVDKNDEHETWLYVRVSTERLNLIRSGTIDLHDAFALPEDSLLLQEIIPYDDQTQPRMEQIQPDQIFEDMLPVPGEFLNFKTDIAVWIRQLLQRYILGERRNLKTEILPVLSNSKKIAEVSSRETLNQTQLSKLFDKAERAEDYPPLANVYVKHTAANEYHKKRENIFRENSLEEIKENLRALELPPPVEQEIMRRIPEEIRRQISNSLLNTAPITGKPLAPWIVSATSLAVVALLIGLGVRQIATFQLPYSFDAPDSATMVEIVEGPVAEIPPLKLPQVNQARGSSGGESENENQENDSVQKTAGDSQSVQKKDLESDQGSWTQTKGPYGGTITSLHATPEGVLFAGTIVGGIFRSTDGGDTWDPANEGLPVSQNNIYPPIFLLTQEANTLYAGTESNLFYSIDSGDSWQQLTHFQDEIDISGFAIIDDRLYIGRRREQSIFFSNDNGKSWTQIDSGLTDRGEPRLFASGTTLFAQMRRHVFRLKAGEKLWTKLIIKDLSKKNAVEPDITEFVVSGETIYATTADGNLFRSTDMGNSWQSIKPQAMQEFNGKLAVIGNTVFYISSADGRVFRSNDAGDSWTMYNTNLTNQSILSVTMLSGKTLYVGTYNGVFRSTDGGESWTKTNTGIINIWIKNLVFFRNALYTVTNDGIIKSVDGRNPWVPANNGLVAPNTATLTVLGGKLYVVTHETNYNTQSPSTSRIYYLADNGNSWVPIQMPMHSSYDRIYGVNQLMVSGETFYVVGQMGDGARLYRWRVGEDLWTQLRRRKFLNWGGLAVSGRTVYISPRDGKLFRSFDEGETWTDVSQNLPNRTQETASYDLAFVGETIYANGDGVSCSTDGGETWTSIGTGLPNGHINIQLADDTTLYGTNSHGIFRLTHGSDLWEHIAPAQHHVTSLTFDGTTFYIGTLGQGIFRLSLDE